jgi:hypothetical protein
LSKQEDNWLYKKPNKQPNQRNQQPSAKTTNNIIDYVTSDGIKLFAKAITPQKTAYDGAPAGQRLFVGNFRNRANTSN